MDERDLGPGNRFFADRSNRLLLGSVGQQHVVTGAGDRVNLRPVFFASKLGPEERRSLGVGNVEYVLVDRRLSSALPLVGVYTERGREAWRTTHRADRPGRTRQVRQRARSIALVRQWKYPDLRCLGSWPINRRPHLDLVVVAIIAIVCTVAGVATQLDPIFRRVAGVLFTVVLPGYAITAALYPRPTIGALERITLTLSMSLAVATLGAVVLNATPGASTPTRGP